MFLCMTNQSSEFVTIQHYVWLCSNVEIVIRVVGHVVWVSNRRGE